MPAVSEKQERFMNAVAHNPEFAAKVDVPQSVGKEFVAKDEVKSAAGVLFVAPDGDVLLLLRSPNEENFASHWALPGGGADAGETPEQAARREVSEEIGNVPCDGMTPLCERVTPKGMVFTTFICPVAEKFVPTLNEEHSGYAWVPVDKPLAPIHPAVADVLSGPFMGWLSRKGGIATDVDFEESKHKRDDGGKFASSSGGEASKPKTANAVHEGADEIVKKLRAAGISASEPDHSINRHGEASSYFRVPGIGEVRYSDHSKNENYDMSNLSLGKTDDIDDLVRYIQKVKEKAAAASEARKAEKAAAAVEVEKKEADKRAIREQDAKNAEIKRQFMIDNGLQDASDTQKKKAWEAHKKAMREKGIAKDDSSHEVIAFDKASVRSYDQDGRMKVERSTISKAIVSPYIGREIVGWKALGLDPNKTYRLLRDPEELKAASDTFNNLPVLSEHVAVSASAPRKDLVIGSTGTDAAFDGSHLTNSLVFWDGSAIQDIEDEKAKELSCAYHYRPDMTPGTYEGEAYDGVMREIKGNHVALVPRGRVGPDAYVADSAPVELVGDAAPLNSGARNSQQEKRTMAHKIPKRDKVTVVKALNAIKPDLAQDADISDIIALVEKLENEGPEETVAVTEDAADIHEFLKAKLSDEDYAAACELLKPAADEEEEAPAIKPDEEVVSKPAMDAAIAAATAKATNDALSAAKAIREAERAVRPYVGEMSMAHDSADAVYRSAFDILGVKHKDVHPSAFPAILAAQTTASHKKPAPMAMDAKAKENFSSRFPDASRIAIK